MPKADLNGTSEVLVVIPSYVGGATGGLATLDDGFSLFRFPTYICNKHPSVTSHLRKDWDKGGKKIMEPKYPEIT